MKNTCAEIPTTKTYLISTAKMAMYHSGWSRWDTPVRRSGRGSRNQAGRALRTCNGHGACCVCVAVWDHEVAVEGLKESFSVSSWDPGERATEERYARRSTG